MKPNAKFTLMCGLCVFFLNSFSWARPVKLGEEIGDSISLPIQFFGFKDDPRLSSMRGYAGSPAIDRDGTLYFRAGHLLVVQENSGKQRQIDLIEAASAAIDESLFKLGEHWDRNLDTSQMIDDRVVIDNRGGLYTILTPKSSNLRSAVMLYTLDRGATWKVVKLVGLTGSLESWDSFNEKDGPPVVSTIDRYGTLEGARYWVERFTVRDGILVPLFPPVLVSSKSNLVSNHSGGSNITYTRNGKIFVVYPSNEKNAAGTVVYGRELNASNGRFIGDEVRLGVSGGIAAGKVLPADAHDLPAITQDRKGIITVIFGAHHGMFQYLSSRSASTMHDQWTVPAVIGQSNQGGQFGAYTYISALTDHHDNIHIFARSEGYKYKFQLVQIEKYSNGEIRSWLGGLRHRVVVDVDRSMYAAWRQRASLDENGCIYLHFKYWPSQLSPGEMSELGVSEKKNDDCDLNNCFLRSLKPMYPTTIYSCDYGETFKLKSHGVRSDG